MKNDIDLLYALLEGVARDQNVKYLAKEPFRKWLIRSAAFKAAEKDEKFVLINRRNRRGPFTVNNMQLFPISDEFEPVDGIRQPEASAIVPPEPEPAAKEPRVAVKKQCVHCNVKKKPSEFYRNPETRDGLASWCKVCTRDKAREGGPRWQEIGDVRFQTREGYLTVKETEGRQRVLLKIPQNADILGLVNKIRTFFHASDN